MTSGPYWQRSVESFRRAQRSYDAMEHPDYYAEPEEEKEPDEEEGE